MEDKFHEVVDGFMKDAIAREDELSIPQVDSSFMYAMAHYTARYYAIKSDTECVDLESFIKEHTELFEFFIRSRIESYAINEDDS